MSAKLKYLDSSGVVHTQSFDVLNIKGLDKPWKWELVPGVINDFYDGSKNTQFKGFRRIVGVELAPVHQYEDFLRNFLQADTKSLRYQWTTLLAQESYGVFDEVGFENEWADDYRQTELFSFELKESAIRTVWPDSTAAVADDLMYIAKKIKIVGTQTSPETFTTNSGKLQYNYGTTVFPAISLLEYNVSVIVNGSPYQERKVNLVGEPAQSGDNITFQLALSDIGNDSDDGFSYADIDICLQEIA